MSSWFQRISQSYSSQDVILGVLHNNFNLEWAAQQIRTGDITEACQQIAYMSNAMPSASAKLRTLSQMIGCQIVNPPDQNQEQNELNMEAV